MHGLRDYPRRTNGAAQRVPKQEPCMNRHTVLLADDHLMVLEGLESLLQRHFEVVGIVSDGRALFAAANRLDPDVIVLDVLLSTLNGLDVARQLKVSGARAKLVFLTTHRDINYAVRALEAGASGFVLKHSAASELVSAIHEALNGRTYVTSHITSELVDAYRRGASFGAEGTGELTPRQREVLRLVTAGRSAKEIASILCISRRTAEFHKARLMETLGLQNTVQLVHYAIRAGISSM
jgi:DNA-binding NarL/FixJ family response regulator